MKVKPSFGSNKLRLQPSSGPHFPGLYDGISDIPYRVLPSGSSADKSTPTIPTEFVSGVLFSFSPNCTGMEKIYVIFFPNQFRLGERKPA